MVRFFRDPRENHVPHGLSFKRRNRTTGYVSGKTGFVRELRALPDHFHMISQGAGTNLFGSLLNAHLAFEALTDHTTSLPTSAGYEERICKSSPTIRA